MSQAQMPVEIQQMVALIEKQSDRSQLLEVGTPILLAITKQLFSCNPPPEPSDIDAMSSIYKMYQEALYRSRRQVSMQAEMQAEIEALKAQIKQLEGQSGS